MTDQKRKNNSGREKQLTIRVAHLRAEMWGSAFFFFFKKEDKNKKQSFLLSKNFPRVFSILECGLSL